LAATRLSTTSETPLLAAGIFKQSSPNHAQLLRRIDWRFLLPDPTLRRVAYVGSYDEVLLSALQTFSQSLITLHDSQQLETSSAERSAYDLLVLRSTNPQDVMRANQMLTSGGYLYWEIDRRAALPSDEPNARSGWKKAVRWINRRLQPRMSPYKKYVAALEFWSFSDIEVHWHRPDFENCLEFIPLDRKPALQHVFSRNNGSLKDRISSMVGRSLVKMGLLPRLIPCFSLVARKSSSANEAA